MLKVRADIVVLKPKQKSKTMKNRKNLAKKSALEAVPQMTIPTPVGGNGHHLVIKDANATDIFLALGIEVDRKRELEQDTIEACKKVIRENVGNAGGASLTLLQLITIASTHAQTDNELVLATLLITEAYVNNGFEALMDQTSEDLGLSAETTTEDTLNQDETPGDEDINEGFGEFFRQMFSERAAAFGMADETDQDQDLEDRNNP